jgi:carboxypeptidase C (cathepsin A)
MSLSSALEWKETTVLRSLAALTLTSLLLATAWGPVPAQEKSKQEKPKTDPAKTVDLKDNLSTTRHTATIGGNKLTYDATAGTLVLKDEDGKARASIFFTAYTKIDVKEPATRPITFLFNGGPGSSSVWLHMGAFGPRRVVLSEDGKALAPPYKLVDNDESLLDVSDLVFIDPVSTGYSRTAPGHDGKEFHGVTEDIEANSAFIRLYVSRFRRWDSPKFLAGESYGTTRSAGMVGYLQDHEGMNFNGVVLISVVLNFQTLRFEEGNDLPYILYLPAYTATAWYHKKLPKDLQEDLSKTLAAADKFALGEYTAALMKGSQLSSDERRHVVQQLAHYTGLTEDYVSRSNLRIEASRFRKELLRKEEKTLGRYDSRFQGSDLDNVGDVPEYDPSYAVVLGPFTALVNEYLRTDLKFETDMEYRILTGKVQPWNYGNAKNRYLNVAPTLRQAMTRNPKLRLFVASGRYDLATPYFATQYTLDHLGLTRELATHVTSEYYPAGHMMYIEPGSLVKLKKDLAKFYRSSVTNSSSSEGR